MKSLLMLSLVDLWLRKLLTVVDEPSKVSVSWLLPHSSRQNQSVVFTWAEWLSIMFTSNGIREFVPRDQVSSLLVAYCSLFLHLN